MKRIKQHHSPEQNIQYASWNKWNAKTYLKMYFSKLGPDSIIPINFFSKILVKIPKKNIRKILDFGCGPTIFGAAIVDNFCKEIHIADYLESNLSEVQSWLDNEKKAFNWEKALNEINLIKKEYGIKISKKHSDFLKKKITKLIRCDASLENPLGTEEKYPIVITMYCPDSATSSKDIWSVYMKNICSLIEPNGYLLIAALRKCKSYKNGGVSFPSANIDEKDVKKILELNNFKCEELRVFAVPECKKDGFTSIVCAVGKKKN